MNRYFFARLIGLCLVLAGLGVYQKNAKVWEAEETRNQEKIAKIEEYNKQVEQKNQQTQQKEAKKLYENGTFEGKAQGFGGEIVVSVTIKEDEITDIQVVSADGEDSAYLSMAMDMKEKMITAQSVDVDTVSGATYSSTGIKNAAIDALEKAKKKE